MFCPWLLFFHRLSGAVSCWNCVFEILPPDNRLFRWQILAPPPTWLMYTSDNFGELMATVMQLEDFLQSCNPCNSTTCGVFDQALHAKQTGLSA